MQQRHHVLPPLLLVPRSLCCNIAREADVMKGQTGGKRAETTGLLQGGSGEASLWSSGLRAYLWARHWWAVCAGGRDEWGGWIEGEEGRGGIGKWIARGIHSFTAVQHVHCDAVSDTACRTRHLGQVRAFNALHLHVRIPCTAATQRRSSSCRSWGHGFSSTPWRVVNKPR